MYTGAGGGGVSKGTKAAAGGAGAGLGLYALTQFQDCGGGTCVTQALGQGFAGLILAPLFGIANLLFATIGGFAQYVVIPAWTSVGTLFGGLTNGFAPAMVHIWNAWVESVTSLAGGFFGPQIALVVAVAFAVVISLVLVKGVGFLIRSEL